MGDEKRHLELVMPAEPAGIEQRYIGNDYAQTMAAPAVEACLRLGLNVGLQSFIEQHLRDLHMVVAEDKNETEAVAPHLSVGKFLAPGDQEPSWHRVFVVGQQELMAREAQLRKVLTTMGIDSVEDIKLQMCALDWIFYEQVVSALGNAYFMQTHHGRYIADFNGQSPYYRAEYSVSADYLRRTGQKDLSLEEDFKALQQGFGLMMLHDSLLVEAVLSRAAVADWAIAHLRSEAYPTAYRSDEIAEHLRYLQPDHKVRQLMAEFAMSVFDPDLEE